MKVGLSELRSTVRIGMAATILPLLAAGCATMRIPEDKVRSVEAYPLRVESRGLFVAVHPLREKEIDETFKTDLLDEGILPVLVVAENRSASTSFLLAKDKVAVVDGKAIEALKFDRTKATSGTAAEVMTGVGVALITPLPLAPLASLPLVIAGLKMASDAQVIQHNLGVKEFQSRTIDPGQNAHGYVYFQYPKGAIEKLTGLHVLIEATDTSDIQPITFDFPINHAYPVDTS